MPFFHASDERGLPVHREMDVVLAGGGWTVGRNPGSFVEFVVFHAGEAAWVGPATFFGE